MQIKVRYLDNLKVSASFDDFTLVADQPIRYKGDGMAPGPFDYFLASSAMCAAYFVKVYCLARNIPTDDIHITQNNIVDPDNRYKQTFKLEVELPDNLSEKDRLGILASIERCTVKKVIQEGPSFEIIPISPLKKDQSLDYDFDQKTRTLIPGKDAPLEETLLKMARLISELGIRLEINSWRNPVPYVWSVHLRDADCPMNFSNGKGSSKNAALCSALGEFIERLITNYFYSDFYLGEEISEKSFVHYPDEKWFVSSGTTLPEDLMDEYLKKIYHLDGDLSPSQLIDMNSGNKARGICALPFIKQSNQELVYIPVNLIGNLFVSNGMSAGNTIPEARTQALSEIFERKIKNDIIQNEITLPDVPSVVLERYPSLLEGLQKLKDQGFHLLVKDASLGGRYPVMCVCLKNPRTGGAYASFGAHPRFEVALERALTELLQGRSFEGLNEMPPPTFNELAVKDHNNLIDHFIDSTGVISWKFFKSQADYEFCDWNFSGTTEEEFQQLMNILKKLEKEVYIADYHDFGACATRILVPGFSEIYLPEELIWNNNNEALIYREDILNLHRLNKKGLTRLLKNLEQSERDEFTPVSELIGVAFEESSAWGQLTLAELQCLIHLKLENHEEARARVDVLLSFNNYSAERKKFYRALQFMLDIKLNPDLSLEDFEEHSKKMFGEELYAMARDSVEGVKHFYGLSPTDTKLTGLEKHLRLLESYKKVHEARSRKIINCPI